MKKIALNSLIISFVLIWASPVFSQTGTVGSTTRPKPIKDALEARKEMMGKQASTSEQRVENRRDLIKRMVENRFRKMFQRFQATIDRENLILGKINGRIEKVKQAGGTTTDAEKFANEAKMHLGEAQKAFDLLKSTAVSAKELDMQVNATTSPGTVTKETLQKMKNVSNEVEKHLRNAHKAMVSSINSLKGMPAKPDAKPSATTTNI